MSLTLPGAVGLNELMDVKCLAQSLVQSKGSRACHYVDEENSNVSLAGPASCTLVCP